jgi:hypothetical protein
MAREVRSDSVGHPVHGAGTESRTGPVGDQAPAPRPRSVRCRRDTDGVIVWIPADQIDDFPGEEIEG